MKNPAKFSINFEPLLNYLIIIVLVVVGLIFSIMQPAFIKFYNISGILRQTALLAIIATGVTYILIAGEFDLSFPFLASLSVNTAVNLLQLHVPGILVILIPILLGVIIGLVNGFLVGNLNINSFITTFGVGTILTGVNFFISGGETIVIVGGLPSWFIAPAVNQLFGFSFLTYIMLAIVLISIVITLHTVFGRILYAIGNNQKACVVAGVNVRKYKYFAYIICGVLAAVMGLLLAGRLGGGHPNAGDEYLMTVFAAVFLGMSIQNGTPNILGTFLGSLLITTIWNGLTLIGLQYEYQLISTALIILIFSIIAYMKQTEAVSSL